MSCVPVDATAEACANCGKGGSDAIKLKNCTACFLVKYCGVDCQKIHRKLHKKACKKRADELKDEKLYSQGLERPEGDFCPLCLLAVPIPMEGHAMVRSCCMTMVCNGCFHAALKQGLGTACPLCRAPPAENEEEAFGRIQKRVAARDPEAIFHLGDLHFEGRYGLEKNDLRAIELWTEAAELGSTKAHNKLGIAYNSGSFGVPLDKAKGVRYWESAAMQGDAESRHWLGLTELDNSNDDRAARHLLISAKMGHRDSLDFIREMFANGDTTEAQFFEALSGHQDAVEEMRSHDRDEAAAYLMKRRDEA